MDLLDGPPVILLPKGIVVNTTEVYAEVASHSVLPTEKIWRYWHVYTVTNKKLKDPTACRLEHFWWHVWGSDRRLLSGEKLAQLFEDISTGPTFVPLRSVANRWEGPEMPPVLPSLIQQSNSADDSGSKKAAIATSSHRQQLVNDNGLRSLSSSASKPPPTHPILKKSRGPSTNGPRPTARFLSPHGSPDEDAKDPEIPSSGSTTATGIDLKAASTPSPAKKKGQPTKRFVASTANKRRPVMAPRRGSSQTSITAEPSPKEAPSSIGSSQATDSQRAVSPIAETSITGVTSSSPASQERPVLSAKAAGKRPAVPRRLTSEKNVPKANGSVSPLLRAAVNDQAAKELALGQLRTMTDLPSPASESSSPSKSSTISDMALPPVAEVSSAAPAAAPAMGRSQSHTGYERFRSNLSVMSHPPGLFTGATASTTNVAAQGTIIDQSGVGSLPPPSPLYNMGELKETLTSRGSSVSLFTPTQPSSSASVPLARTKSQLTLLLEREKERLGDRASSRR